MNLYPSTEARLSALERQQAQTNARFEEVTGDMAAGFKHINTDIEASFKQFTEYLAKIEEQDEKHFNTIERRLDKIEATMATKDELLATETRILDAFRQLVTTINRQDEK